MNATNNNESCQRTTPWLMKNKLDRYEAANITTSGSPSKAKSEESNEKFGNVTSMEEEDDDDVICVPPPPPPLVCIDSTDNESDNEECISQQQIGTNVTADDNIFDRIEEYVSPISEISAVGLSFSIECANTSDCSGIQKNTKNRARRMIKYKSSSKNGSDSSKGTDILKDTSTPCVKNVRSFASNERVETRLNDKLTNSQHSEDVLRALNVATDDTSINKTNEDSSSIEPRQLVANVVEKTFKTTGDDEFLNIEEDTAKQSRIDAGHNENAYNFAEDSELTNEKPTSVASVISEPRTDNINEDCVQGLSVSVDPEIGWNDEMKRFYRNSWGGENFNVTISQRPMTNSRHEWKILDDDKHETSHTNRNSELKCIYCGGIDHKVQDCTMLTRQTKCHMCGQAGHSEPRCPETMCLRCGSPTSLYSHGCGRCHHLINKICALCKTEGHGVRECPDKWRRYHSTIDPGQPLTKLPLIFNKTRYCCICAGKGHTAEYCPDALSSLDTPAPSIRIQSYCNVYDPIPRNANEPCEDVARFALISAPAEDVQFSWDIDESPNRFYGRIMAVTKISRIKTSRVEFTQKDLEEDNMETSDLFMASSTSDNGRTVRMAKSNKRVREATVIRTAECSEITGPATKIRKQQRNKRKRSDIGEQFRIDNHIFEITQGTDAHTDASSVASKSQHRNKLKRSDIEEPFRDDNEMKEIFNITKEQFDLSNVNTSDDRINSAFLDGLAEPNWILKESLLNNADEVQEAIRIPNTVISAKFNEFDRNIENFEQKLIEDASRAISPSVDKLYCFDSDSIACCSKEMSQSFEMTTAQKELTSYKDTNIQFDELIPPGISSEIQVDVHQVKEDLPNADVTPLQLRIVEKATADFDGTNKKKSYKWKVTLKRLPSNRLLLIKFIEGHLLLLQKSFGNVDELYRIMCLKEKEENTQGAARIRRKLNIILMGQMGLRSGSRHLRFLQSILKTLYSFNSSFTTYKLRKDVFRHYLYIFTPFEHDDYPSLISECNAIREQRLEILESVERVGLIRDFNTVDDTNRPTVLLAGNENIESKDKTHLAKEIVNFNQGVKNTGSYLPESIPMSNIRSPIKDQEVFAVTMNQHTIFMTKRYYKNLNIPNTFLADLYSKHDVVVYSKTFEPCIIFVVEGTLHAQINFLKDLIDHSNKSHFSPKYRNIPLIKFLNNEIKTSSLHSNGRVEFTQNGNTILTDCEHDGVRVEWHFFGEIFIVEGPSHAQISFRSRLIGCCQMNAIRSGFLNRHKTRRDILLFIEEQMNQLKSIGNVRQLYKQMCAYEKSMYTTQEADSTRKLLNIILMGQAGLRDGPFHLKSLQSNLQSLRTDTQRHVSKQIKSDVFQHYQYIFSPFRHDDYPGLINEYEALPKYRLVPDQSKDETSLLLC